MNFSIVMELHRAWRRLLRAAGFSLYVIVLIALSIGGVAAGATAGWSLFARPLPHSQAEQLVAISVWGKRLGSHGSLSEASVEELTRVGRFETISLVKRPFELRIADGTRVRAARIGLVACHGRGYRADDRSCNFDSGVVRFPGASDEGIAI